MRNNEGGWEAAVDRQGQPVLAAVVNPNDDVARRTTLLTVLNSHESSG